MCNIAIKIVLKLFSRFNLNLFNKLYLRIIIFLRFLVGPRGSVVIEI